MNRETNRSTDSGGTGSPAGVPSRKRVGVFQFLREVRAELKRVHWPSRSEVVSYSLVVLVAVTLLTLFVFLLDQAFGQLVLWLFG